ncbi:hypothetical protein WME75_41325 [Sorangium sp. So ce1014]|uniref:hypothetical protein n=1 Tax=Sorangium sp. So ce1014 TaxID=3133326 RepID=UPI003F633F48
MTPQRYGELLVEAFGEAAEPVEARCPLEAFESNPARSDRIFAAAGSSPGFRAADLSVGFGR